MFGAIVVAIITYIVAPYITAIGLPRLPALGPTPTKQAPTQKQVLTVKQQAEDLIKQLYSDVNSKNYQDAYNLWKDKPNNQSLADFSKGYASTQHIDVTTERADELSDGTIQVFVTLNVTDEMPSGADTKKSDFQGYYIVGWQNGKLKIFSGNLKPARSTMVAPLRLHSV